MNEIKIHVEDDDAFFKRAAAIARKLDRGQRVRGEHHLSFESIETLLKTLTPNRWALLRSLKSKGASSIRSLAAALRRDYKAVHVDVTALLDAGLITRDDSGLILVPWSRISADLDLAAA